ncbi:helix-turn-helix domain-containing protein [Thermomonospora curvata]|uniref:Helix-turn-helix domain protein n=1 Tax=Thermomonospora curvata (strain ATCC 19995 / DSM 43183 / JCM 3096 / KCTC 9072 / NBRC 15933 / NCIMB 10081 / Henssen B9) TaxID=471852 RepID=D1A6B9_THECD|nr:helix-turn-helix transcriptional regulator [Thermomonospora curvata]ACZ00218.1 helix-turn-helix domain protein [Thermomonospora curvata DSM 43183]
MAKRTSPTVRRRRLAAELKRLRKEAGKTREEVADFVACAPATITKIESAATTAPPAYVARMLELYGVDGAEKEAWLVIAKQARKRGWWQSYNDAIPNWFSVYVGLEQEASKIREYECEIIPGLLQTEGYIRAVMDAAPTIPSDEEVERRVAVRLKRQELLENGDAPDVWVILNEAAVRREVGGPEVMREQLAHLVELSQLNTVTLQVLPFSAGAHPALQHGFTILGFAEPTDPDVVYVEYATGGLYLELRSEVDIYGTYFDHLRAKALAPDESRRLIMELSQQVS